MPRLSRCARAAHHGGRYLLLGVVLFELVTRHRPYATRHGSSAQLEMAIAEGHLIRAADAITDADASACSDTCRACAPAAWRPGRRARQGNWTPPSAMPAPRPWPPILRRLLDGRPVLAGRPAAGSGPQVRAAASRQRRLSTLAVCSLWGDDGMIWQRPRGPGPTRQTEASLQTTRALRLLPSVTCWATRWPPTATNPWRLSSRALSAWRASSS